MSRELTAIKLAGGLDNISASEPGYLSTRPPRKAKFALLLIDTQLIAALVLLISSKKQPRQSNKD
jgi:hypothetical protein